MSTEEEKSGAFITYLLTGFLGVIGAVIGWAIWKDKGTFAKSQTTEALNWGITLFIVYVVIQILARVLIHVSVFFGFLIFLIPIVWVVGLILGIMAALKAKNGESYSYPFALRLVK